MATVVVTDHAWPSVDIERRLLGDLGAEVVVAPEAPLELARLVEGADAVLTNWRTVPDAALRRASRCVIVSRYGIGVDNIPVDTATELGIVVANVPDFCLDEVSDHVMALLLSCARRIPQLSEGWELARAAGMARIRGQTLGLVGFGNTARALIPKALAFGLRVLVYTPRLRDGDVPPPVERAASFDDLLARSDFVSLHVPVTPETRGLIGERELARMKPTSYVVNVARGALIDEDALARAVKSRAIAGAALDVLATEPPPEKHPLIGLPGVIVTPHAAFYSEAAIEEVRTKASENVALALCGELPPNIVNPRVLETAGVRLANEVDFPPVAAVRPRSARE